MPSESAAALDRVLALLDRHEQRATYGAVGAVVGRLARSVMQGRPRDARHSWVVRQTDGRPSGYTEAECHPALRRRPDVLSSEAALRAWLAERTPAAATPVV